MQKLSESAPKSSNVLVPHILWIREAESGRQGLDRCNHFRNFITADRLDKTPHAASASIAYMMSLVLSMDCAISGVIISLNKVGIPVNASRTKLR